MEDILDRSVYINATGSFFPNPPVTNDEVETVLGQFENRPSRAKHVILASNKIKTRHYAIDPQTRQPTHSNAKMTAEAIADLFANNPHLNIKDVQLLCCGTSSPDLLIPAHAQMVHGELKEFTGEAVTTSGVCCSSIAGLKMAYLSVRAGDTTAALVTGSEIASKHMRSEFLESENQERVEALKADTAVAFERDFLRWMLSDGAGSVYLSDKIVPGQLNFKINWIEGRSYAHAEDVCMMAGGYRNGDGSVITWHNLRLLNDAEKQRFAMSLQQDIRLLKTKVTEYCVELPLAEIKKKRGLQPGDYKWFLPHYSSDYFRGILAKALRKVDFEIPEERWFTSLYERGNIGSASMFVFINELIKKARLEPGDKILCHVPESARFSVYFFELEVV